MKRPRRSIKASRRAKQADKFQPIPDVDQSLREKLDQVGRELKQKGQQ